MSEILGAAAGGILGMIGANNQHKRQKELMGIQHRNQQALNIQGSELQYDMWKKTNYPAQMKMLQEAGLNPAMMYGQGGQGGTTGSQSGGSAASGTAAAMDISQIKQMALLEAQIKKIKAETENIQKQSTTESQRSGLVMQQAIKTAEEVVQMSRLNEIGDATKQDEIERRQEEAIKMAIENDLKQAQIEKTEEEIDDIRNRIYREWVNTGIKGVQAIGGFTIGGKTLETVQVLLKKLKAARKAKRY